MQALSTEFSRLFIGVSLLSVLLLSGGCGKSPQVENFKKCLPLLDEERQQARQSQNFSYGAQKYLECRAPVQYGGDS